MDTTLLLAKAEEQRLLASGRRAPMASWMLRSTSVHIYEELAHL